MDNIYISVRDGIWATTPRNEDKLNEAFRNSERVTLIFSVNNSRNFQGYATMTSHIDPTQSTVWLQPDGVQNFRGSMFHVRWERRIDLHFSATANITNPLNDNMPVKRSRDCQELPADVGRRLCLLFDQPSRPPPQQLQPHMLTQNLPQGLPPHGLDKPAPRERQLYMPNPPVSESEEGNKQPIRYFVLKSSTAANVEIALRDSVWATTQRNEDKLNRAFEECDQVVLIFSVNHSGHFQGYAVMTSAIDAARPTVWMPEGPPKPSFTGGMFHIKWETTTPLGFKQTMHLLNPLNNNFAVRRSQDGQELPPEVGRQLCQLLEDEDQRAKSTPPVPGLHNPGPDTQSSPLLQHFDYAQSYAGFPGANVPGQTTHADPL